jgi:hypothetical protein
LVDELAGRFDSAIESERASAAQEAERARISTFESLNQTLRRLREAKTEKAVFELLAEASASYAERVVVLRVVESDQDEEGEAEVRAVARRGAGDADLTFRASKAHAVTEVMTSREPVSALAAAPQLPEELASALGGGAGKVYLFPLNSRQEVMGVLVAGGRTIPSALELLSGAAGITLDSLNAEALSLKPLPSPGLVQITQGKSDAAQSWNDLTPDDQRLHLQAQRVARVKVAEMRLYHADELRDGIASGNLYGSLQAEIDSARKSFLQTFLSKSPTMVDYLHLEILRSLAHDDDRLLGENYPGPMA